MSVIYTIQPQNNNWLTHVKKYVSPPLSFFAAKVTEFGHNMELNSFSGIWKEFKEVYSKQKSDVRGLDCFALFALLILVLQIVYAGLTGAYPFNSMISGICMSLGFFVLIIALRCHLTKEIQSTISEERAFVEFVFSCAVLFLFVWNFMN